jgi:hypothetical protein
MVGQSVFRSDDRDPALGTSDSQRLRRCHDRQTAPYQQEIDDRGIGGSALALFCITRIDRGRI